MKIHAMVSRGRAHHSLRDVLAEIGGGGGRGTLVIAVPASLVPMALMTVTEVTTRIAVVGVVSLVALFVVARPTSRRIERTDDARFRVAIHGASITRADVSRPFTRRGGSLGARMATLALIAVTSGAILGILVSLVLTTILNTMNEGV